MLKQSNIFYYALMVLLLCLHVSISAQELVNPSFEGVSGVARQPHSWQAYGTASSPDTQPGAWNVNQQPSNGSSYISMVCRGYSIFNNDMWESAIQGLNNSLTIGETYHYSIDLAHSKTFKADTIRFDKPSQLRIWGMSNSTEKELLWESDAVANTDWKTFFFEVTPNIAVDYLILEAYYAELPKYCGNVLVDNMKHYPHKPVCLSGLDPESSTIVDNNTEIPTEINNREISKEADFTFRGNKLNITVWDNRTTVGDIISLF